MKCKKKRCMELKRDCTYLQNLTNKQPKSPNICSLATSWLRAEMDVTCHMCLSKVGTYTSQPYWDTITYVV